MSDDFEKAARTALTRALDYRKRNLDAGPPGPTASLGALREAFDIGLPETGREASEIIELLADAAEPGLVGNTNPNHFGWVMGGSHPVGVAADWLTSTWGQNSGIYPTSPSSAVAEEVVSAWLLDLMDLPRHCSVGFVTGATMAGFTCLAAARTEVLRRIGWDLEAKGQFGAPPIDVFLGQEAHSTIYTALRYLGFGEDHLKRLAVDSEGLILVDDLERQLAKSDRPKIVICQAGHINSGGFDDLKRISALTQEHGGWLHVDGAFGLWVRASPKLKDLATHIENADSWSVDGHKWLQVPYDAGFAIVKHPAAHARAMDISASYLETSQSDGRKPSQFTPELSRRARGFAVWATLQALGRRGIAEMVERHVDAARYFGALMEDETGIEVLNDVVLNQVVLGFSEGDELARKNSATDAIVTALARENTSFAVGAEWKDQRVLRVSVISQETGRKHMDQLARSIITAWRALK